MSGTMREESVEEGLGDLFGGAEVPEPVYPLQELLIDRVALAGEGTTTPGVLPRYDGFDPVEVAGVSRVASLRPAPLRVFYRDKRHSLWGHRLWNAAKYLTKRIDSRRIDVRGRTVLELGAGLGVPSWAALRNGARLAVVTDYPDADLLDVLSRTREIYAGADALDADLPPGPAPEAVVEPLLWGDATHIRRVRAHTKDVGFDLVLLSDILFNHVCNDALAETVAQTLAAGPSAAAYCVFSHHRAHKQVEDLQFFDLCVAKGLQYTCIDAEDYPLMFPDDQGPEEVRRPVWCYRLTRRLDAAGPPLEATAAFDVVLQGTGLVSSLLSAALARGGCRVLHCDGAPHYGGTLHATLSLAEFGADAVTDLVRHREATALLSAREQGRFLIDLLPSPLLGNGDLIRALQDSDMARHVEFHHVDAFVFLEPDAASSRGGGSLQARAIPLTRSAVFDSEAMNLLEKRRMLRFITDLEASLVEQHHASSANPSDDPAYVPPADLLRGGGRVSLVHEPLEHPAETLDAFLGRRYHLDGAAREGVTLWGTLDVAGRTPAEGRLRRSTALVHDVLTSVGRFGGTTPFLLPAYGTSEVAQNLCRCSAVWGGLFTLRRSLHRVGRHTARDTQYAILSNGQAVPATVIVVPEEAADAFPDHELGQVDLRRSAAPGRAEATTTISSSSSSPNVRRARVVVCARRALFTWNHVATTTTTTTTTTTAETDAAEPPLVHALARTTVGGPVVYVTQVGAASEQAPEGAVVVHFTADAAVLSAAELYEWVCQHFLVESSPEEAGEAGEKEGHVPPLRLDLQRDVVLLASFTVDAARAALASVVADPVDLTSETRLAHSYAVEAYLKRCDVARPRASSPAGVNPPREEEEEEERGGPRAVVTVSSLGPDPMDAGRDVEVARRAFAEILAQLSARRPDLAEKVSKMTFLERLPPLPSPEVGHA